MRIEIIDTNPGNLILPLTFELGLGDCQLGGSTLRELLYARIANFAGSGVCRAEDRFWPSEELLKRVFSTSAPCVVIDEAETPLLWTSKTAAISVDDVEKIQLDEKSLLIRYPWDFLKINEQLVGELNESRFDGERMKNVSIQGNVILGVGSVLLPGVFIEGNVVIGKNCKIGPNCYIRGATHIGDDCHVGQSVEVKNSILMNGVSAGHLSYIGDSIIGENTNIGAGTITANFRHDGKNHRSMVDGALVDTGRRKFGCVMGSGVHTGIHTSIYPGRKIWAGASTLPGEIVREDILSPSSSMPSSQKV